jgi:hypothetical protein
MVSAPSTALLIHCPIGYVACDATSRQKGNLIGKSEFYSFASPNDAYIGHAITILSPVQVLTISGNEPKSGQASGNSGDSLWLTDSNHQRFGQRSNYMRWRTI